MEAPAHMGYTHPRLRSDRNKPCAPFTVVVYVAALSDYLQFQVTQTSFSYVGPPLSVCLFISDVSGRTNTAYGLSRQSNHVCAVLTHVL